MLHQVPKTSEVKRERSSPEVDHLAEKNGAGEEPGQVRGKGVRRRKEGNPPKEGTGIQRHWRKRRRRALDRTHYCIFKTWGGKRH